MRTILCLLLALVSLSGCAHYQLGTGNKPAFHTIAIAPIVNQSFAPQVHTLLADALFREFSMQGGVQVRGQAEAADATLQVTLTQFTKYIGASSSTDTGRARSMVLQLQATATLLGTDGKALYSQSFDVSHEVYADTGANRAEAQGMPQLAQEMARKIVSATVSRW